jgi:pyruvate formate lyase activating enzyme
MVMGWHVTQFYPAYRMLDRRPTPVATLRHAREIGLDVGLRYVYEENVPGEGGDNTHCYTCKTLLIRRYGVFLLSKRIRQGQCPTCGATTDGDEMDGSSQGEV